MSENKNNNITAKKQKIRSTEYNIELHFGEQKLLNLYADYAADKIIHTMENGGCPSKKTA